MDPKNNQIFTVTDEELSQNNFYNMIENYERLNSGVIQGDENEKTNIRKYFEIARIFKTLNISSNQIVGYCCQAKQTLNVRIGNDFFVNLFDILSNTKLYEPKINTIEYIDSDRFTENIDFDLERY